MSTSTIERLRTILEASFAPSALVVRDDSALHAGHAGAREGGHYHVEIASQAFAGRRAIDCQRLVYAALGDLPTMGIHALSMRCSDS